VVVATRLELRKGVMHTGVVVLLAVAMLGATLMAHRYKTAAASSTFEQYAAQYGMYFSSQDAATAAGVPRDTAIADAEKTVSFPGATVRAALYEYRGQAVQVVTDRMVWVVTFSGKGVLGGSWGPLPHGYPIVHVVLDAQTGQTLFSFPGDA
jgi:hypothetical protein